MNGAATVFDSTRSAPTSRKTARIGASHHFLFFLRYPTQSPAREDVSASTAASNSDLLPGGSCSSAIGLERLSIRGCHERGGGAPIKPGSLCAADVSPIQ